MRDEIEDALVRDLTAEGVLRPSATTPVRWTVMGLLLVVGIGWMLRPTTPTQLADRPAQAAGEVWVWF
jgi:hypothetical protein